MQLDYRIYQFMYFSSPEHKNFIHDFRKCFSHFVPQTPYRGFAPGWTPLGDFRPQTPLPCPLPFANPKYATVDRA